MKAVLRAIKFIINHPLNQGHKFNAFLRFIKWHIISIIDPHTIIHQYTIKSKFIIKKGMNGATGNLYCGLTDYEDMFLLLHFLRESDLFIDIGANVGAFTLLASAHIGAKSVAIEPVPATFSDLLNNIYLNNINDKVDTYNIALGSKTGKVGFTQSLGTCNRVAIDNDKDTIIINIDTLDNIVSARQSPAMLKIDVEGFESEVIDGASKTLNLKELKVIIIELNGAGKRYNYDEILIHKKFVESGFSRYTYDPLNRSLTEVDNFSSNNTIYIRDKEFVLERLATSPKVTK